MSGEAAIRRRSRNADRSWPLAGGGREHPLQQPGPAAPGPFAQLVVVGGRLPPAVDRDALLGRQLLDRDAGIVVADEQADHAVALAEDGGGDRQQQARAVSRPGVGRHRAPVHHAGQPVEGGLDDRPRRPTLGVGDEADAARVELAAGRGRRREKRTHGGLLVSFGLSGLTGASPLKGEATCHPSRSAPTNLSRPGTAVCHAAPPGGCNWLGCGRLWTAVFGQRSGFHERERQPGPPSGPAWVDTRLPAAAPARWRMGPAPTRPATRAARGPRRIPGPAARLPAGTPARLPPGSVPRLPAEPAPQLPARPSARVPAGAAAGMAAGIPAGPVPDHRPALTGGPAEPAADRAGAGRVAGDQPGRGGAVAGGAHRRRG